MDVCRVVLVVAMVSDPVSAREAADQAARSIAAAEAAARRRVEPPRRIWLQWNEDEAQVTWCSDKINDDDVEYVRVNRKENE